MSLDNVYAGDYGQPIELTFIDVDTFSAANISGYSDTIKMIFITPEREVMAKTATFKTDGTDGIIRYVVEQDFLTAGKWSVRGQVASGAAQLTTEIHGFEVEP